MYEESWCEIGGGEVEAELVVNPKAGEFYTNHWVDTCYPHVEFGPVRLHPRMEDGWAKWIYLLPSHVIEGAIRPSKDEGNVYRCTDGVFAVKKAKLKKVKVSKNSNLPLVECIDDGFIKLFHCFVPSDVPTRE